jgi:hypothetical protein
MRPFIPLALLLLVAACASHPLVQPIALPTQIIRTPEVLSNTTEALGTNRTNENSGPFSANASIPPSVTRRELVQGEQGEDSQLLLIDAKDGSARFRSGGQNVTLALNEQAYIGNLSLRLLAINSTLRPRRSVVDFNIESPDGVTTARFVEGGSVANVTLLLVSHDARGDRALFRVNGQDRAISGREEASFGDISLFVRNIYYARTGSTEIRATATVEIIG